MTLQDWTAALVPYAVALLCQSSCDNAAAALVVAHTGLHSAFASLDNGLSLLADYLRAHAAVLQQPDGEQLWACREPCVQHAVQRLWAELPEQVQRALQQQQLM